MSDQPSGDAPADAPPIRIGVLGCADIARRRMLPALAASRGISLVAVAGRDGARARETAARYGCAAVTGYDALLARDDLDAVYVPLPIALHAEWVEAALRSGRHVLAEKPLTGDPDTTRRLLELARERGLVVMENVMFVHHPQHAAVRRLVSECAIGRLKMLTATFTIPELPSDNIRYRPDLGGGALMDVGLYPVRAASHLLGSRLEVVGAALRSDPGRQVETSGAALLVSPEDVLVHIGFGIGVGYRSAYELCGSEGSIRLANAFTPAADHHPVLMVERATGTEPVVLEPCDQVAASVAAFVSGIRAGRGGLLDAEDCLEQARLLSAIRRIGAAAGR